MPKLIKRDGYCAPLALHYVSGHPDELVYEVCSDNGFTPDFGMEEHEYLLSAHELGIRYRRVNLKKAGLYRQKVSKFLEAHPHGMYLIHTDSHLFVIHDGSVIDPLNAAGHGMDRMITGAWKIFN